MAKKKKDTTKLLSPEESIALIGEVQNEWFKLLKKRMDKINPAQAYLLYSRILNSLVSHHFGLVWEVTKDVEEKHNKKFAENTKPSKKVE